LAEDVDLHAARGGSAVIASAISLYVAIPNRAPPAYHDAAQYRSHRGQRDNSRKPDPDVAKLGNANVVAVAQTASEALEALDRHKQEWDLGVVDPRRLRAERLARGARPIATSTHVVLANYPTGEIRPTASRAWSRRCFRQNQQNWRPFSISAVPTAHSQERSFNPVREILYDHRP
jgi:hypothetical protein